MTSRKLQTSSTDDVVKKKNVRGITFLNKFSFKKNGSILQNCFSLHDIDGDGQSEFICASLHGRVRIYKHNKLIYRSEQLGSITNIKCQTFDHVPVLIVISCEGEVHFLNLTQSVLKKAASSYAFLDDMVSSPTSPKQHTQQHHREEDEGELLSEEDIHIDEEEEEEEEEEGEDLVDDDMVDFNSSEEEDEEGEEEKDEFSSEGNSPYFTLHQRFQEPSNNESFDQSFSNTTNGDVKHFVSYRVPNNVTCCELMDINDDGYLDLILGTSGRSIYVYRLRIDFVDVKKFRFQCIEHWTMNQKIHTLCSHQKHFLMVGFFTNGACLITREKNVPKNISRMERDQFTNLTSSKLRYVKKILQKGGQFQSCKVVGDLTLLNDPNSIFFESKRRKSLYNNNNNNDVDDDDDDDYFNSNNDSLDSEEEEEIIKRRRGKRKYLKGYVATVFMDGRILVFHPLIESRSKVWTYNFAKEIIGVYKLNFFEKKSRRSNNRKKKSTEKSAKIIQHLVVSTWDGDTYIFNEKKEIVYFELGDTIESFLCGYYSTNKNVKRSLCLFYSTIHSTILCYEGIKIQSVQLQNLNQFTPRKIMELYPENNERKLFIKSLLYNVSEPEMDRFIKKMNL